MNKTAIPTFAILGHPNEGKSSVVSTLAEDDSVRISPVPGETRECREYPVTVDAKEIIRFIDTPGFQQPRQTLKWLAGYSGQDNQMLADFIASHRTIPDYSDECELFAPLSDGAGIIFVVDGSRPVRQIDKMEMEILRLTGLPRMAVINIKEKNRAEFFADWKSEARKHFNTIRIFDAHQATYRERIDLLESLKNIDQEWQPQLEAVISAFKQDWQHRIDDTVSIMMDLILTVARHTIKKNCQDESQVPAVKKQLEEQYKKDITHFEKSAHKNIRKRFKHNIFNYELPPHSIVNEDLFSKKSWRILGLKPWQLAVAGAAGGSAVGAKVDIALAGLTFGVFTAIGGLLGGGSAALGASQAIGTKVKGLPLGRMKIQAGPVKNEQVMYILLDRALIYFSHIINWAHSRRDQQDLQNFELNSQEKGFTSLWDAPSKKLFNHFFRAARRGDWAQIAAVKPRINDFLVISLKNISQLKQPAE
jgi:GTPase Era involved in 16S rRNA processing